LGEKGHEGVHGSLGTLEVEDFVQINKNGYPLTITLSRTVGGIGQVVVDVDSQSKVRNPLSLST
jgi:hypothetical protein